MRLPWHPRTTPWRRLPLAARAFRSAHAAIAVMFLLAIAYVWLCALTGRRDRLLHTAVALLVGEGVFVAANHGDCPLGPVQDRLGDPVPLFELVLPPRAARLAVPALGAVTAGGIALLLRRQPAQEPMAAAIAQPDQAAPSTSARPIQTSTAKRRFPSA